MKRIATLFMLLAAAACSKGVQLIPEDSFKAEIDGKQVSLYTIKGGDLTAQVTNFGARIISLWTPDRKGGMADIIVGYGTLDKFVNNTGERFLGANPGPVANRIAGGTYELGGETFLCPVNNGNNTLHGGLIGLDMLVWDVIEVAEDHLKMSVLHPDGVEGFPGNTTFTITYTLTEDSEMKIEFGAVSDKDTPVNLAHHGFFNLRGCGNGDILGHVLTINASHTTPVDAELIPSGEIVSLDGSPLDFREPHAIGERINADDEQLRNGTGYDHNWCIDRSDEGGIQFVARLQEPEYGRVMEIFSDQPGLQFYSGNFFDGKSIDKYGKPMIHRCAVALETQKWPDAVHHPNFPDIILKAGDTYSHTCIYKFSAE